MINFKSALESSVLSFDASLYFLIPVAYLLGSIPFGVLAAKTKGIDLQNVGSRNIGASNVFRTAGKSAAAVTLIGDFLKGTTAVLLCRTIVGGDIPEGIIGIAVILGHMYSLFLSFKGGKGVATGFGVLVMYSPVSAVISIIFWLLTALYTRYSSLASITAFASFPILFVLFEDSQVKIYFVIIIAILIILRHKDNIRRLLEGTEGKIGHNARV